MAASEQSQNVQPRSSSQDASLHTTVARLTARVNRSISSSYASRRKPRDSSSSSSRCAAQQEQHANERERHDTASGEVGDTCHDGGHTTAGIDATRTDGCVEGTSRLSCAPRATQLEHRARAHACVPVRFECMHVSARRAARAPPWHLLDRMDRAHECVECDNRRTTLGLRPHARCHRCGRRCWRGGRMASQFSFVSKYKPASPAMVIVCASPCGLAQFLRHKTFN